MDTVPIEMNAKNAQEFLKRANLTGQEVEAYINAYNMLEEIGLGELVLVPKSKLEALEAQPICKCKGKKT